MNKYMKWIKPLLWPHIVIVILTVIISIVGLVYAFAYPNANRIVAYAAYFVSAYALTVVCIRVPDIYKFFKMKRDESEYIGMYRSQADLRVKISLYTSFTINILYAVLQFAMGLIYHSVWYYSLAGYYILLVIMRFFLLRKFRTDRWRKDRKLELSLYRLCGVLLIFMNIALGVVVFYIVRQNRGFQHHYIVTIGLAAYTFTIFTMAIVNIVRYKKYHSPVISASKVVSLVSALVSMLSLETAMLEAFGDEGDELFRRIMTASSGGAVCVAVLVIAVIMIVKSTRELRRMRNVSGE